MDAEYAGQRARVDRPDIREAARSGHLVAIVGPTATGKTELASELAAVLGGEIVGADSVQVYRRFDVGSGKPTADERARAPHHLVDLCDPAEALDAASYANLARAAIADIFARGKTPIVCGGTFLWVKALLFGLAAAPSADRDVRARHEAIVAAAGRAELHRLLAEVDPVSALRLHPNDSLRVGRALEVFELTGRPLSELQASHAFGASPFRPYLVARAVPHDELTARIHQRVVTWLASGWVDEVAALVAEGFGGARAMGSVGYRQVHAHVLGELPREDLVDHIARATRVYARRQRTWLNHADVHFTV